MPSADQLNRVLLGKIDCEKEGKMTYVYDQHVFHYIVEDGIVYMCMCDDNQEGKRRIPYAYLDDVKERFKSEYGGAAMTAIAFAMNDEFGHVLQTRMEHFNSPEGDQLASVVDKTDQLQTQAFQFNRSSRKLRSAMFWKKMKCYALVAFVTLFVVWIISVIACGGVAYQGCRTDDDDD